MTVHGIELRADGLGKFSLGKRSFLGEIVGHRDVLPPHLAARIPTIPACLEPILRFVWRAFGADPYRASI